mmetsp:Transcript_19791/g.46175  ORF Transcript_19791/g.46175 Transcript_19791/m.46175 type:complete len:232 (+) Transcript_19791:118-813(+)
MQPRGSNTRLGIWPPLLPLIFGRFALLFGAVASVQSKHVPVGCDLLARHASELHCSFELVGILREFTQRSLHLLGQVKVCCPVHWHRMAALHGFEILGINLMLPRVIILLQFGLIAFLLNTVPDLNHTLPEVRELLSVGTCDALFRPGFWELLVVRLILLPLVGQNRLRHLCGILGWERVGVRRSSRVLRCCHRRALRATHPDGLEMTCLRQSSSPGEVDQSSPKLPNLQA